MINVMCLLFSVLLLIVLNSVFCLVGVLILILFLFFIFIGVMIEEIIKSENMFSGRVINMYFVGIICMYVFRIE